ncbi:hypothetical protein H072_1407 [Dactylellina haptotyla CBS 200.50]|uniref:VanZ-like domain-containing protein n=1 Tax=Dactylellina haptotyla (strain CBS 200.50) TaxID=1284197 RepID=S8BYP9_DACHA|nr:hypothetical protein H072_1407 [Dactylellina haptotyla CBS 200.50]
MRIRPQIAGAFAALFLVSAYLGISKGIQLPFNDKIAHFLSFFSMTLCFYWVLDTSRRRVVNFTLIIMFGILGVGSEFVQAVFPGHIFDAYDILANLVGASAATGLCMWYHKRMLERKRQAKQANYHVVGNEEAELGIIEEEDEGEEEGHVSSTTGPQINGETTTGK